MAGRGPAPKDPEKRRRRNADQVASTKLVADNRTRGPALPKNALPDGEAWHDRTVAWWTSWRKSALARTFSPTDWDFLLDTALMHHTMWSKGRWEFASEVRLRSGKFGATPEDRLRLRMEIEQPPPAPSRTTTPPVASVTDIVSRRARLTG